ncbi:hypothetical protein ALC60_10734 [Trachymyrmex zeteki]|uniref:Uncharacterized protein n=1 Tax=Mycetomoellerius zeteki TaxID=64791 RepID=A0A151WR63_9HYME|nr:hypothetical protein ALC60_10734 [Trachymyrmex zeteki]
MTGSGPAEKMGLKELEAHTRHFAFAVPMGEKENGRKRIKGGEAMGTRVTYPNVCGPHRAM